MTLHGPCVIVVLPQKDDGMLGACVSSLRQAVMCAVWCARVLAFAWPVGGPLPCFRAYVCRSVGGASSWIPPYSSVPVCSFYPFIGQVKQIDLIMMHRSHSQLHVIKALVTAGGFSHGHSIRMIAHSIMASVHFTVNSANSTLYRVVLTVVC